MEDDNKDRRGMARHGSDDGNICLHTTLCSFYLVLITIATYSTYGTVRYINMTLEPFLNIVTCQTDGPLIPNEWHFASPMADQT